ncbi:exodeoxyribonuclease III [Candidatus Endobugula sertula]|uniref:Exodeoxyribonuclease III n=1 Tax=Candidatus Endobugula sertula TaxID=62101 RepID=A0A1D2QSM9_9GAMM|nr:exodeoxyribonuclease III [Candidatus Endobugula sertula]
MKVISINVNGIRAAAGKGMFEWLAKVDADVICFQELKAYPDQIEDPLYHPEGYHAYFHSAEKKGYAGVGIYCKQKPKAVYRGLGAISDDDWFDVDREGRYIQVDFSDVSVVSLYMPSGSSKRERQDFKYAMMGRFETVLRSMLRKRREFIICGDWNIAHKKVDIKNWRGNQKNSGFLPEERAWMDWLLNDDNNKRDKPLNFVDAFRVINQKAHEYTWWSNRGQAWANNTGWRIDYQIITPGLANKVITGSDLIYKEERFSDHAPLVLEYQL